MKLICLGDSQTYGFGVSPQQRWTRLLASRCGIDTENRGVNGDTTGGMLVRLNALLGSRDVCDCVFFIMGGGNDIFFSGSDRQARANLAAMTQHVLAAGALPLVGIMPQITPALCPPDWGMVVDFDNAERLVSEYREWLRSYCTAFNIASVDFGGLDRGCFTDGLHPDGNGHSAMADILYSKLHEMGLI